MADPGAPGAASAASADGNSIEMEATPTKKRVTFGSSETFAIPADSPAPSETAAGAAAASRSVYQPRAASEARFGRGMRKWDSETVLCQSPVCSMNANDTCRKCGKRFCPAHFAGAIPVGEVSPLSGQSKLSRLTDLATRTACVCEPCLELHAMLTLPDSPYAPVAVTPDQLHAAPTWRCKYNQFFEPVADPNTNVQTIAALGSLVHMFLALQYTLPTHEYSLWERLVLWYNRELFAGHTRWLLQLMRSLRPEDWPVVEDQILALLHYTADSHDATDLECTRLCSHRASWMDAIEMLGNWHPSLNVHAYAVSLLIATPLDIVLTLTPTLVAFTVLAVETHGYELEETAYLVDGGTLNPLAQYLVGLACTEHGRGIQLALFMAVDNYLQQANRTDGAKPASAQAAARVYRVRQFHIALIAAFGDRASNELRAAMGLMTALHSISRTPEALAQDLRDPVKIANFRTCLRKAPVKLPWDPTGPQVIGLDLTSARLLQSARCPLLVAVVDEVPEGVASRPGTRPRRRLFHKVGDDLRQDDAVLAAVRLMARLLNDKGILVEPVSYSACPLMPEDGLVECVPDATTLMSIADAGYTIGEWLLTHGRQNETLGLVCERFTRSVAFWAVAMYLLGVCDRNFTNIMVTTDGSLFHIDFAFILGDDPHHLFDTSQVALDSGIIRVLGGQGSPAFEDFINLARLIYLELRPHAPLFMTLLSPCPGINIRDKHNEFCTRFQVGNWDDDAGDVIERAFLERKRFSQLMQYRTLPTTLSRLRGFWDSLKNRWLPGSGGPADEPAS